MLNIECVDETQLGLAQTTDGVFIEITDGDADSVITLKLSLSQAVRMARDILRINRKRNE